jgi:hypothetical protein
MDVIVKSDGNCFKRIEKLMRSLIQMVLGEA